MNDEAPSSTGMADNVNRAAEERIGSGDSTPVEAGRADAASGQPQTSSSSKLSKGTDTMSRWRLPKDESKVDEKTMRPPALMVRTQTAGPPSSGSSAIPRSSATYSPLGSDGKNKFPDAAAREESLGSGVKEKKKAVSFLSRLLPTNRKRSSTLPVSPDGSPLENASPTASLPRPDGMESPLLAQDVDNIEFSPRIPQPPSFVKVRARNKRHKEFDRLFLAQELRPGDGAAEKSVKDGKTKDAGPENCDATWAVGFSRDGKYLASAGQDHVVRIWAVISTPEEREAHDLDEEMNSPTHGKLQIRASVFQTRPVREYLDHEGAVLDLSWSKNNFLLTTSLDRTIRLWHPSRSECLCTFKHSSQVFAIAFHPRDDRFFLAGAKDSRLRLWSIPDKRVEFWTGVGDIITAVAFGPDGKTAMAGTMSGTVVLYATEGLKYLSQFTVRSKKKSRVTAIEAKPIPPESDVIKILVTSAESRVRMYNMRDKALEIKFKAHRAEEIPIRASFSDDGRYVICGSEDKGVYIWSVSDRNLAPASDKDRDKTIQRPLEHFEANAAKTTCAIVAPKETRIALGLSADPIYDICNPPPVKLFEREGSIASAGSAMNAQPRSQSRGANVSELRKGSDTPRSSNQNHDDSTKSAAYASRAVHLNGAIIVTASTRGSIRVYRQDCAFKRRKSFNALPVDSSARRLYLRQAIASSRSSFSTPNSARPVSVRTSNSGQAGGDSKYASSVKSFKSAGPSITASMNASPLPTAKVDHQTGALVARPRRSESISSRPSMDRIEMWRADVDGRGSTTSLPTTDSAIAIAIGKSGSSASERNHRDTPRSSGIRGAPQTSTAAAGSGAPLSKIRERPKPDTRGSSIANPLRLRDGQSFMFWNTSQYARKGDAPIPDSAKGGRRLSQESDIVSRLTSEEEESAQASANTLDREAGDDDVAAADDKIRCAKCDGTKFREAKGWGFGKGRGVVCDRCGFERKDAV